ncbi:MAG: three-Cys-motif partner protein TcmP [Flavobacteriales bacterium]
MAQGSSIVSEPKPEGWGGSWTEKKLVAFEKYVKAYLTIMAKNPYWKTIYFDGFAGSGERKKKEDLELMNQLAIVEAEEQVYQGAAERLLRLPEKWRFHYYYFIDKSKAASEALEKKLGFVDEALKEKLVFRSGDGNAQLLKLAELMKKDKKYASLVFLDPFGMQVSWKSIAELKDTRTDIWILIPTGVIVNRLLDRKGELKSMALLCEFFGLTEDEVRKQFYGTAPVTDLFGEESEMVSKVIDPINKIARLYIKQLGSVWKSVTPVPLRLNNSTGSPIFHFVMASNNKDAVRIAQEIIAKT